tara:strand:+ start:1897 stop:3204 length:1308 start_codon:yes stop_codon:yes gene_type:complete
MAVTEAEVKQKMLDQTDQKALDASQTIKPVTQVVDPKEEISSSKITAPTVAAPTPVKLTDYDQTAPAPTAAATYTATDVAPNVGDATAAQGTVSNAAVMNPAQGTVSPASLATAATANLDPRATTQYQMGQLMSTIQAGQPLPAWAAPQVRNVTAIMQQRGLGASSMAAAAMVQAVTESGIQIASQDAGKYATIQLANLSNEQQAALQNAATNASMDMANLNNRQQAAVQNSKSFLAMDMANLNNEQQSNTITYQSQVAALLADGAADNAAKQFNAKSENEVDMFFAELGATIQTTTLNRKAGLEQFNVSQKVAVDQFNAQMQTTRDQFNANMQLQVDQSNVNWRRTVNTNNTAAKNEANRQNVLNLLGINQNAMNNIWQTYRDQASWNMKASENAKDRAHNAAMQSSAIAADKDMYDTKYDDYLMNTVIDNIFS